MNLCPTEILLLKAIRMAAAMADLPPDSADEAEPAASEPIHPDRPDLSESNDPEIPDPDRTFDPMATITAAAIEAAAELGITDLPEFIPEPNPPVCADLDPVADDLVAEANSLRLAGSFSRLADAIYVLTVLIDLLGKERPAMAYELARIADHLEGELS